MHVRCNGNAVLVRPDADPEQVGRILVPEAARRRIADTAILVGKGPGFLTKRGDRWPMPDIELGARVVVDRNGVTSGTPVLIDGVKHVLMSADNVLGEVTP